MASNFLEAMRYLGALVDTVCGVDDKKPEDDGKPEILTKEKLRELKWMNSYQLASIYGYGKRKVVIDDDPGAYQEIKWMNSYQLKAIFGGEGEEDDGGNG